MNPKNIYALYTGGGKWNFTGKCITEAEEERYFLITEEGFTLILDADPMEDPDESRTLEWQDTHQTEELGDGDRAEFTIKALNLLQSDMNGSGASDDRCGGITEQEIDRYRENWKYLD